MQSLDHRLIDLLCDLGCTLGYEVVREVEASASAWVDVVWFDNRLPPSMFGKGKPSLRRVPALPIIGFEVEVKTGLGAKHVKGSVSNLNNLGALMGCIVLGTGNLVTLGAQKSHVGKPEKELETILLDRVYRWVYAESQPNGRVVIMMEREIMEWAERAGITVAAFVD